MSVSSDGISVCPHVIHLDCVDVMNSVWLWIFLRYFTCLRQIMYWHNQNQEWLPGTDTRSTCQTLDPHFNFLPYFGLFLGYFYVSFLDCVWCTMFMILFSFQSVAYNRWLRWCLCHGRHWRLSISFHKGIQKCSKCEYWMVSCVHIDTKNVYNWKENLWVNVL